LWDKREVFKILHRPIYKGFVSWNDKLYQGIHQPIISEKIFDQVQLVFQDKIKYQADTKTNALLQRLIFCGCCNSIMTPSHSLNRHKQKYFYYRCTSTQNAEKATSKCEFKYVPMAQLDQFLLEFLLSLSNESYWTPIELKILKHNQQIEIKAQAIKEEIKIIESKLQAIKDKKDQYLDTLILKSFNQSERQLINKRIEDMELEDKQLKGGLYKQEFELTKLEEEKVNIIEFKKIFVMFKADYEILSAYQKKEFILNHIKSIIYFPDRVSINLKLLPWPLDHYFKEARI
jgi:site-specific DNA recombinase